MSKHAVEDMKPQKGGRRKQTADSRAVRRSIEERNEGTGARLCGISMICAKRRD